jgi:hypothetical protein
MSSKTIKKLLLSLIVVGILGSFTARGTYAIFNGQTGNSNQSISSGTILMTNSVAGGSTCYSTDTPANLNINTSCSTLFTSGLLYPITSSTPPAYPSTTVAYSDVTIASAGRTASLAPTSSTLNSTLSLYMSNCDASQTTGSPAPGGTNPCCPGLASGLPAGPCPTGSLDFFIQEYDDAAFTSAKTSCLYPADGSNACTFATDSLGNFFAPYHDNTHYFPLGTITAGTSRYFRIGVAEPINAANTLQGETATFSLYWHMD